MASPSVHKTTGFEIKRENREGLIDWIADSVFLKTSYLSFLTFNQDVTNGYFRYLIKIESNQSKSIIIYQLISKIDGNRLVEFLWWSILSILIEQYQKNKKHNPQ